MEFNSFSKLVSSKFIINPEHKFSYLAYNGFFFFVYGLVKYFPTPLGNILRYLVLKGFLKRVKTLWIQDGATFWFPDRISIGRHTSINEFMFINGAGGVEIGDNVLIGHRTSLISDSHGFDDLEKKIYQQPKMNKPIKIGNNVFIGCGVIVLPGVAIDDGAVIGAGTIVTKDVPAEAIVVGNPGRIIGFRGER